MAVRRSGSRGVAVPVSGEVLAPRVPGADLGVEAWARPVAHPVPYGSQEVRIVVEHAPAASAVEVPFESEVRGPSWGTAAAFMAVLCILLAIGVGLWLGGVAPWETDAQQQQHSAPAHHGRSAR
jgi:hypothetical protein